MTICKQENCTGCGACIAACPKRCIALQETNAIGHVYPVVDESVCISCGLCQRVCPQNKQPVLTAPKNTYAAWSLNQEERKRSSSGGLASYFSRKMLENGGVVYGCSSNVSAGQIAHVRCETEEQAKKLRGSKYVQSRTENSFTLCKNDLQAGKEVLFIGTPCQVDGLKAFLGKPYENLTTADLVCHGVAPQKLLFEHLKNLSRENGDEIAFRTPHGMRLTVIKNGATTVSVGHRKDAYYMGFLSGLYFRDNCYACLYAKTTRMGDITLGDFWGLGKEIPFEEDQRNGVSLLLVNTRKGEELLQKFADGLFIKERTLDEAKKENGNLYKPSAKHKHTEKFKRLYAKHGFEKAAKKCLKRERLKYKIVHLAEENALVRKLIRLLRRGR